MVNLTQVHLRKPNSNVHVAIRIQHWRRMNLNVRYLAPEPIWVLRCLNIIKGQVSVADGIDHSRILKIDSLVIVWLNLFFYFSLYLVCVEQSTFHDGLTIFGFVLVLIYAVKDTLSGIFMLKQIWSWFRRPCFDLTLNVILVFLFIISLNCYFFAEFIAEESLWWYDLDLRFLSLIDLDLCKFPLRRYKI